MGKVVWTIILILLLCCAFGGCAYVRDQDAIYDLQHSRDRIDILEAEASGNADLIVQLRAENAVLRTLANQEFKIKLDPIEISEIPIKLIIKFPDGTEQAIPVRGVDNNKDKPSQKIGK